MRPNFAHVVLTLPLVAALCSAAEKAPVLPKELPSYGPDVPFRTVPVSELKLPNGLTVWLASDYVAFRPYHPEYAFEGLGFDFTCRASGGCACF